MDIRDYKIIITDLKDDNRELRRLLDIVGKTVVDLINSSINVNTPSKKKIEIDQLLANEIALLKHENKLYKYYLNCVEFNIKNGSIFKDDPLRLIEECNRVVGLRRQDECTDLEVQIEKIICGE